MSKKLTIELEDDVYDGLTRLLDGEEISEFLSNLVRPYLINHEVWNASETFVNAQEERKNELTNWIEDTLERARWCKNDDDDEVPLGVSQILPK